MAVKPKDAVVQFRVDSELLEAFRALCDHKGETVSQALRSVILGMTRQAKYLSAERARTLAGELSPPFVIPAPSKRLEAPIASVRVPESLSERRRLAKLAKNKKKPD